MIEFQRNGQCINVWADGQLICYFHTTTGRNPRIALLGRDIQLETLAQVVDLIRKTMNHEKTDVGWKT